jgi:fatty acid amide hydrolase
MTDLTHASAVALARMLAAGEVSSEEVTHAHLDRIEAVDGRVHAFVSVMRDEALAAARRADEERRRGEVRGPLHGMPVSVKESLEVAGQASTLGVASRKDVIATRDAGIVQVLREAGAVILGRTNVAQLLLFHESRNPLFGQTVNPWSPSHTPGGSTGGEAAAIASGMSPLGIGTDIGGSIRVPAHFTGTAGLKPTLDRWINQGSVGALMGQEAVRGQVGPMARTAKDLALLMGALDTRRMSALDPRVPPLPMEDPARVDLAKLRVGFAIDDGLVPPSNAVARAVSQTLEALRGRVAAIFPFRPPGVPEAIYAYFAALSADGGEAARALLEGGEIDVALKSLYTMASLPNAVRKTAARGLGMVGEERLRRLVEMTGKKSVSELWRLTHELRRARAALIEAMDAAAVDVILCPPFATPALPHTLSRDFALAASSSIFWNITQLPAGVVPVTRVRASETDRERPRDRLEKQAAEVDRQSAGLPVGVQVVGRPWAEAVVLAVMTAIEDELTGEYDQPLTPYLAI